MALQLIWKFCNGCNPGLQLFELQLVADFYIKILCSRFCNWLQLPSCRATFSTVKVQEVSNGPFTALWKIHVRKLHTFCMFLFLRKNLKIVRNNPYIKYVKIMEKFTPCKENCIIPYMEKTYRFYNEKKNIHNVRK